MNQLKILVASQNQVKADAALEAFQIFSDKSCAAECSNKKISSGVSDQPKNLEEAAQGALNRLNQIKQTPGYDYFVAIEGGMYAVQIADKLQWYESACAAVYAAGFEPCVAYGPAYPVPDYLSKHIQKGDDLNQATEKETGIAEIGSSVGFNGWLTDNKFDRKKASAQATLLALFGLHHERN